MYVDQINTKEGIYQITDDSWIAKIINPVFRYYKSRWEEEEVGDTTAITKKEFMDVANDLGVI